ncbi:uncharacterized protein TEOVI_000539300 [Trypanosoma equiperdum]|uniref:Cilia- and flagella-associated protein 58 central coiled coil domain-containing protein n=1 Tax=Trypanosoma equiperdum TaxID=5694 RepID=A0A1G4HZN0_TRYEQ|nr:hypothetical protein, conserved [Trypanosoma equiperdum]
MSDASVNDVARVESAGANRLQEIAQFDEVRQDNLNFEYYERQFQEVLMSLENDEVLAAFRTEYASLYHSFLKSHDGESRLLKKCIELQADIDTCSSKLVTADELSRGDKNTIDTLRIEIEKTRKKIDVTKEREAALKDKVAALRRELRDLEEKSHLQVELTSQKAAMQSLQRTLETVTKERELQALQLSSLRQDYSLLEKRMERLREVKDSGDMELQKMRSAIDEKQEEADVHKALRLRKEEELRELRQDITQRAASVQERQTAIEKLTEESSQHNVDTKRTLDEINRLSQVYQQLSQQLQHVNQTSQVCNEENDTLQRRVNDLLEALKAAEVELKSVNRVHKRELKVLEAARRRNAVATNRRAEAEANLSALQMELRMREDQLAAALVAIEAEEKHIALLLNQRNSLHRDILNTVSRKQQQIIFLDERRSTLHHLEYELHAFVEHAQQQNEKIFKLSRECDSYENVIQTDAVHCANIMCEVQLRESQLEELNQNLKDVDVRLQQQQGLLEAMVRERSVYSKHYIQLCSSVAEISQGFKSVLMQIKQIQEEIQRRERRRRVEDAVIEKLSIQQKNIAGRIARLQRLTEKRAHSVRQFNYEVNRLGEIAVQGEEEVLRQRRRCHAVQKERDTLEYQVVQRDSELLDLYKKLQVQRTVLDRGSEIYQGRLQTIQHLQQQIGQVSGELARLRKFASRLPELRVKVNTAARDLRREQLRVEALMQECVRPMNIHPNHQLSWSEPEVYALTEKVNHLQRELVTRHAELAEKEDLIRSREQSYLKYKAEVARQVGPEMAEQIAVYQGNLAKKTGQMRAMMQSLKYFREQTEMYQERYNELHATLDRLAEEYIESRQRSGYNTTQLSTRDGGRRSNCEDADVASAEDVYKGFVASPHSTPSEEAPRRLTGSASTTEGVGTDALQPQHSSPALPEAEIQKVVVEEVVEEFGGADVASAEDVYKGFVAPPRSTPSEEAPRRLTGSASTTEGVGTDALQPQHSSPAPPEAEDGEAEIQKAVVEEVVEEFGDEEDQTPGEEGK